jgi:predicted DCC family thiol-disulfide oxidoreductase YuxK
MIRLPEAQKRDTMITLADEFTDRKERSARGWLFFDAGCSFCTRIARWVAPILRRRGLGVAPLQDPRVGALLAMSRRELLKELRFLKSDGSHLGGANAVLSVAHEIWWARPLVWVSHVPGATEMMHAAYGWVAARRKCGAMQCNAQ